MRGRRLRMRWGLCGMGSFLLAASGVAAGGPEQGGRSAAGRRTARPGVCRTGVLEGDVRAGESFARPIGGGLQVRLQALAWGSGWVLRVLPVGGEGMEHDYAEIATPPYASVNPLVLSTDFSFRAQDAVAWNPRRFRFAATAGEFARLLRAYERYGKGTVSLGAESDLAALVSRQAEGSLQILDVRFIPGTANQAGTAAMVATHFSSTAHVVEEPPEGKGTPLGKLSWVRFRVSLNLPRGFVVDRGVAVEAVKCPSGATLPSAEASQPK